jgi:hypothetical protein
MPVSAPWSTRRPLSERPDITGAAGAGVPSPAPTVDMGIAVGRAGHSGPRGKCGRPGGLDSAVRQLPCRPALAAAAPAPARRRHTRPSDRTT